MDKYIIPLIRRCRPITESEVEKYKVIKDTLCKKDFKRKGPQKFYKWFTRNYGNKKVDLNMIVEKLKRIKIRNYLEYVKCIEEIKHNSENPYATGIPYLYDIVNSFFKPNTEYSFPRLTL